MVATRRSSKVVGDSRLPSSQDDLPEVFPVSPSHSFSSSNNGSDAEDEEQNNGHAMIVDERFLATLIADPLYIHGQILKEAAEKESNATGVAAQLSEEMVYYEKPVMMMNQKEQEHKTLTIANIDGEAIEKASAMIMTAANANCKDLEVATVKNKKMTRKQSSIRTSCNASEKKQKINGGVKLLSVLHTCPRSQFPQEIRTTAVASVKPPQVLQTLFKRYGFHSLRIKAKTANYQLPVSEIRQASLGKKLLDAVDTSNLTMLDDLFRQGVSPNASNKFGDDILFSVCKRSNQAVFTKLLDANVNVNIVDSLGRTALHYCAWAQRLDVTIVKSILTLNPQQLFVEDYRGQTPLDHVNDEVAEEWNNFLNQHFDSLYGNGLPTVTDLSSRTVENNASPEHLHAIRHVVA